MDWRRGLFRLWGLCSLVWCAAVGAYAYTKWVEWTDPWRPVSTNSGPPDLSGFGDLIPFPWTIYAVAAIGVPLSVFVLGLGLRWVNDGFRAP